MAVWFGNDVDWLLGADTALIGCLGSDWLDEPPVTLRFKYEGGREGRKKDKEERIKELKERRGGREEGKKGIGNTKKEEDWRGERKGNKGRREEKGKDRREREGQGREVMTSRAWA